MLPVPEWGSVLGHIVSENETRSDPEQMATVRNPANTHQREVAAEFPRSNSYYHWFMKDFDMIAAPLHHPTKKGRKFGWAMASQDTFKKLEKLGHLLFSRSNPT